MSRWNFDNDSFVTTKSSAMDKEKIFQYLHNEAYWCKGIPRDICMKSLEHSVPFSLILDGSFAGFARLVSDQSTFAYLCDVFVLETYRGKGYGKFLINCVNNWLDTHNIRTSLLLTRDAQGLYAEQNWIHPTSVQRVMRYKEQNPNFYYDQ